MRRKRRFEPRRAVVRETGDALGVPRRARDHRVDERGGRLGRLADQASHLRHAVVDQSQDVGGSAGADDQEKISIPWCEERDGGDRRDGNRQPPEEGRWFAVPTILDGLADDPELASPDADEGTQRSGEPAGDEENPEMARHVLRVQG